MLLCTCVQFSIKHKHINTYTLFFFSYTQNFQKQRKAFEGCSSQALGQDAASPLPLHCPYEEEEGPACMYLICSPFSSWWKTQEMQRWFMPAQPSLKTKAVHQDDTANRKESRSEGHPKDPHLDLTCLISHKAMFKCTQLNIFSTIT